MIIVFTGNGKGKTTAALGQAMRAVGRGKKVLVIQFIKGPWKSGEDYVALRGKGKDGKGKFLIKKMGKGFVGILGDTLPRKVHQRAAEAALAHFRKSISKYDVLILDEVNVALSLRLIRASDVVRAIKSAPKGKMIILTGRGAPKSILAAAQLVTEMREIKHPFQKGRKGEIAIEF
ncbi:cob(I)yrinic acid a,c-diamide adenosyltransferase [Candidatus Parcubacteria bacterium]|nr:MAG: cob(I)yrinic acid a,c-diamide adenosyltransferase [Candidatus Parcubacteria bacterium]